MKLSRLVLTIALLPLVTAASVMCIVVPYHDSHEFGLDHQQHHVIGFLERGRLFNERKSVLRLNLLTGDLEELLDQRSYDDAVLTRQNRPSLLIDEVDKIADHPMGWKRFRVRWMDRSTMRYGQPDEFVFPDMKREGTYVIDERFVVTHISKQFVALDLRNPTVGMQTLDHEASQHDCVVLVTTNDCQLVRGSRVDLGNPTLHQVPRQIVLVTIDESGQPKLVKRWSFGSQWCAVNDFGTEIASITPDLKQVQFHSTKDGTLAKLLAIEADSDANTTFLHHVSNRWFSWSKGLKRVDIDRKQKRMLCETATNPKRPSKTTQLCVFGESGQLILSTVIPAGSECKFLDDNRLIVVSRQHILNVMVLDIATGAVFQHWMPYAWVLPALIFICIGYLCWSIAWIVTAGERGGSVWTDTAIVLGLPLLLLIFRLLCFKVIASYWAFDYVNGILIGGFMATAVLSGLSNISVPNRLLPNLLFASLTFSISLLIHRNNVSAHNCIGFVSSHVLITIGAVIVARRFGWRLTLEPARPLRWPQQRKTSIYSLLFLHLCVGAFFASLGQWYERFPGLPVADFDWTITATIACSALATVVALKVSRLYSIGLITVAMLCVMLINDLHECLLLGDSNQPLPRTYVTAIIANAITNCVYRQRGLRLRRGS